MTDIDHGSSFELPEQVSDALYEEYPTYRAIVTILSGLKHVTGLTMHAGISKTPEMQTDHPVLNFTLDNGRLFLLRISCPDRIFMRFATRTDLRRFMDAAKPEGALSGKELSANPKGWPSYFEMMTAFSAGNVDYVRITNILPDILERSPIRRVIKRPEDSELESLLKDFNIPQEEHVFDEIIERILDLITDENFDEVMKSLEKFDPNAETDPGSVPGLKLILMFDLVHERGIFLKRSLAQLPSVIAEFEKIGEQANADLREATALMSYIQDTLN